MVSPEFELATLEVKKIEKPISNDDLLLLYAYFKIAHGEDFAGAKQPGTFDFQGKYKYAAWKKEVEAGVKQSDAETKYIELADKLRSNLGFDAAATKSANGKDIPAADLKRFDELVAETGKKY